jgi:hypothetical protein
MILHPEGCQVLGGSRDAPISPALQPWTPDREPKFEPLVPYSNDEYWDVMLVGNLKRGATTKFQYPRCLKF